MLCPFCASDDTKVLETRLINKDNVVRRRRECNDCNARFATEENAKLEMPRIIKSTNLSENFDEDKLNKGFFKALEKRPVNNDDVKAAITKIKYTLAKTKKDEVMSSVIGGLVMDELKKLDEVAYIRFASVYRKFKDLETFKSEIDKIIQK